MIIRPAEKSELEALLDLWEALMANGEAAEPRFHVSSEARQHMRGWAQSTWFERHPFARVWVASTPELVGFVHGFPRSALPVLDVEPTVRIGDLFVRPSARGQGVGRALVEHLLGAATRAGFPRAEVGTLTADSRARAFWTTLGFGDLMVTLTREPT